jgi:hypothetical protein
MEALALRMLNIGIALLGNGFDLVWFDPYTE